MERRAMHRRHTVSLAVLMVALSLAGRAEGAPYLVKDINPRSCAREAVWKGPCGSSPDELTEMGGRLFFRAFDPAGGSELWMSDGTEAGTVRVADINAGPASSYPSALVAANGALFFVASDATGDSQLWKSDGTADGTFRVADRAPVPRSLFRPPGGWVPIRLEPSENGVLFTHGLQLWRTDGTADGTAQLFDFSGHDTPDDWDWLFTEVNGSVFFTVCERGRDCELWKTDGSPQGTARVAVI